MISIHEADILAIVVGASFASGINVYATVATLGLLSHLHIFQLPTALQTLNSWPVILAAAWLFALEFFADKIPLFDLFWNALHTFIRIPIAALLAYGATQNLSPAMQIFATLLGGVLALAAHSGKVALRTAVTPSPEPFSNIGLSMGEDVLAISLTWLATQHPIITAAIVATLLLIIILAARAIFRALLRFWQRLRAATVLTV